MSKCSSSVSGCRLGHDPLGVGDQEVVDTIYQSQHGLFFGPEGVFGSQIFLAAAVVTGDTRFQEQEFEDQQTVGLIEVMKTFTHLAYTADGGLPENARIVRVLVGDGDEVREDDPLLEVETG